MQKLLPAIVVLAVIAFGVLAAFFTPTLRRLSGQDPEPDEHSTKIQDSESYIFATKLLGFFAIGFGVVGLWIVIFK